MIEVKNNIQSHRSISQIFTPSNFKKIIRKDEYSSIQKRLQKHIHLQSPETNKDILAFAYLHLLKNYKSEYFYKNALINKLLLGKYSLNTTTALNEFRIGNSVADIVLLNGEVRVFEIKTELDSLEKLSKQISDYCQFANKIYVVTNSKFIERLISSYKKSPIGIIEYTENDTLREVVAAKNNDSFDHSVIFKSLRKKEYIEIVNEYFGYIPNVPNTKIFKQCLELAKTIEIKTFQKLAFEKLKERKLKCPELLESDKTPFELKHICYSLNMNKNEYLKLYQFLNQTL